MKITDDETLSMSISGDESLSPTTETITEVTTDDYEKLQNLPTLNGKEIKGAMNEEDPTVSSWAKEASKPSYTPEEVSAVPAESAITLAEIDEIFRQVFND